MPVTTIAIPRLFWIKKVFSGIDPIVLPPYTVASKVVEKLEKELHPREIFSLYFEIMKQSKLPLPSTEKLWKDLGKKVVRVDGSYIIIDPNYRPLERISTSNAISALFCPIRAFLEYQTRSPIEIIDYATYRNFLKGLLFHRELFKKLSGETEIEVGAYGLWGRVDALRELRVDEKRCLVVLEAKATIRESFFTPFYYAQVSLYGGIVNATLSTEFDYIVPVLVSASGYFPTAIVSEKGLIRIKKYTEKCVKTFRERKKKQICSICKQRLQCIKLYLSLLS